MRVLIACEFSGIVRDAFAGKGHYALSCDIIPTESPGRHYTGDVFEILNNQWDLMIAHPPCTHIAVSGNRWYAGTNQRKKAVNFVEKLWGCGIPKICIENPVGVLPTQSKLGKPIQYIHPWQFGHGEVKKTGLWLKKLPMLKSTNIVNGREQRIWKMPPSSDRSKLRSKTYKGIAYAMADQWG